MSERRKIIRNIATTAAALGVAATAAGEVQANSSPSQHGTMIEAISGNEQFIPTEKLTEQTAAELKTGNPVNYYHGSVNIYERDGSGVKFIIDNPILIPRVKDPRHPNRPASTEYALGYFKGDATPVDDQKNLGGLWKLQVIPFRHGMKFNPFNGKVRDSVIKQAKFNFKEYGLDIYNPLQPDGSPILDPRGNFAELVGVGVAPK